jgi:outer membrane protein TolC
MAEYLFRRASEESPSLKALQKGPEEAYLMEQVERRRGWPQVSFETNFTLYDSHQEDAYRDQEFFITIDMDIFGKHALRATALEAEYTLAREHQRMEKWLLFQQVAKCYYRVVASLSRERLSKEELEWASKLYQKTQTLVKKGILPKVDLIKAEGELQEAKLNVEDASKEKDLALAQMRAWVPDFKIGPLKLPEPPPIPRPPPAPPLPKFELLPTQRPCLRPVIGPFPKGPVLFPLGIIRLLFWLSFKVLL